MVCALVGAFPERELTMTEQEAWLDFWFRPWRWAEPGWLDDAWGEQWRREVGDNEFAARLSYSDWLQHFSWDNASPADVPALWRAYACSENTALLAAIELIGAAMLPDRYWREQNLSVAMMELWRWSRRYRLLQPLTELPADWPTTPTLSGLALLQQTMRLDAAGAWPRLSQRFKRDDVEACRDLSQLLPQLDVKLSAYLLLCRAALRQAQYHTCVNGAS
jgi:hypothetical protein